MTDHDQPSSEEPLTADAFRHAAATTRRVTPVAVTPGRQVDPSSSTGPTPPPPQQEAADRPAPPPVPPPIPEAPAEMLSAPDATYAGLTSDQGIDPEKYEQYGFTQFREDEQAPKSPAEWGWRGRMRRLTRGVVSPGMSEAETRHRSAVDQVQAHFTGPKTIVFVNPKGGATTTTSTLLAGRTFGTLRGGQCVAWDNNETRGTLGQRARPAGHWNTARELLDNIHMFEGATARIGDLGLYLRGQGGAHFDVLASDERPEVTGHIDAREVGQLHELFQRFYKVILVDTGNNMRAPNWLAAVTAADLLVVTATVRRDTAEAALWMLDALEKQVYGAGRLKPRTITLLAEPSPHTDPTMRNVMKSIFSGRTRAVVPIPYDPALVDGGVVNYDRMSAASHEAWLHACAEMATALNDQQNY